MSDQMNMDVERAAFEAWLRSRWPNASRPIDEKTATGSYAFTENNLLWEAWQAARRTAPVSAPMGEELPDMPTEAQLRHTLKEIPLCYPWGTGRKLVREGMSLDWVSQRESTGSNTQLADMNRNFVNSTIAATVAVMTSYIAPYAERIRQLERELAERKAVSVDSPRGDDHA
jgi:hypothetical protein